MAYQLTQHAKDMLQEREIAVEWLEKVLDKPRAVYPDPVDDALEHRLGVVTEAQGRVLRIVVDARVQPIRVITVYFDRNKRGKI
ncbi:DUF4258 domain-containing protein [Nitrospina watsonii]|uniref:DUF4258 domain-containing protein n=1 Tax=Nitrospina watsonii TaxID=1323948 RepID=A0ABM9HEP3_9BACT|nr:DUF4258 domain-containing protein [Nitrospina watsonii]CAI2718672.1 conserved protein of unknown function [Nitrospina watsonii]